MAFTHAEKRRQRTCPVPFMVALWVAWSAVALMVHPTEGHAQSAPTIASVEMECDLEGCSDPVQVETWLDLAGLYPGRALTDDALRVARTRLLKTSLFESVEFQRRETSAGRWR
jgi:hypothetical protein